MKLSTPFRFETIVVTILCVLIFSTISFADTPKRDKTKSAVQTRRGEEVAPHLLLIKIKSGYTVTSNATTFGISSIDAVLKKINARSIESFHKKPIFTKQTLTREEESLSRLFKVYYDANDEPTSIVNELNTLTSIEYAEPYYIFPLNHTPNDPMLSQQWVITIMKLKEAWDITTGDSTIIIGDIDTGVDWTHEDLNANIYINKKEWGVNGALSNNGIDDDQNGKIDDWHGWDFIGSGTPQSPLPDNNPMDGTLGHGTNTSGCASAVTNNGAGIASPGYRVKILPVKTAADITGPIGAGYEGIIYASDIGCRVINCSWGSIGPFSQALQDVINYAASKGALVVTSAGNNPLDNDAVPHQPSSLFHVLNVGSIETNGGASSWSTYGTSVHVYAPGSSVLTTRRGGGYDSPSGTSFSSPLTCGVAALVFSVHPGWTPDQVAKQIRVTCDPFQNPPSAKRYGRVNAYKAVTMNNTLTDIPGILLRSFSAITPSGTRFTEAGQTAHVTMTVENVLAPTSSAATATVEFDDAQLTASTSTIPIGALSTFETKNISFDVTLSNTPRYSEGYLPVRLKITDGNYIDYVVGRIQVYLSNGWHTQMSLGIPYLFTSIDAVDESDVWATVHVQNQNYDYGFKSSDGGTTWFNVGGTGFPNGRGVYCVRAIDRNTALIGTGPTDGNAQIYRTTNSGQTWTGTSVSAITGFVNWIHMFDAANGIFQGDPKNGIWGIGKTTDGGRTWTAMQNRPVGSGTEAGWNNSYDFIGDVGYFGTNNRKIYKTTNRGETWTSITAPDQNSVGMSWRNENVGIVRFSTQNSIGSNVAAITTNGGTNWTMISSVQMTTSGAVLMERNGKRTWFVNDTTVYRTVNLGQSWIRQEVPGGFLSISCEDVVSTSSATDAYLAGVEVYKFRSAFESATSVKNISRNDLDFKIEKLYPNPYFTTNSSALNISFSIPKAASVTLRIYDSFGKRIETILDEPLSSGAHEAIISLNDLPTGVYHCRMFAGNKVAAKSFVVVK